MTTLTIAPRTATRKVCTVCQLPASDTQNLVYEIGGYIHPQCSARSGEYVQVTEVSFPDDEPDPTTPAPAANGLVLCDYCAGICQPFQPGELCDTCQEAVNDWEGDRYIEPDRDALYERYQWQKHYLLAA